MKTKRGTPEKSEGLTPGKKSNHRRASAARAVKAVVEPIKPELPEPVPKEWFDYETDTSWLEIIKKSVSKFGVLEPVLLRRLADGKYQIMSGYTRIEACRELKLDAINAVIIEDISDAEAREIVSILNAGKLYASERLKELNGLKARLNAHCGNKPGATRGGKAANEDLPEYML